MTIPRRQGRLEDIFDRAKPRNLNYKSSCCIVREAVKAEFKAFDTSLYSLALLRLHLGEPFRHLHMEPDMQMILGRAHALKCHTHKTPSEAANDNSMKRGVLAYIIEHEPQCRNYIRRRCLVLFD